MFWNIKLIISIEEIKNVLKIVQSLEESWLLIKSVSQATQNKAEVQKGGFLSMLLATSHASLLGSLLADEGARPTGQEKGSIKSGDGVIGVVDRTIKTRQDF